jgi:uncharacterized protein
MRRAGPTPSSSMPVAAGVGLRFPHHERFLRERPAVAWLEVHAENYLGGGTVRDCLGELRCEYPVSLHGVGLSLGSAEGVDPRHLERIAALAEEFEPQLVSEHLSWSVVGGDYLADLLPLPLTEEALELLCRHVTQVQERLNRRILIENPSTYLEFEHSSIPEWEFLSALAHRTGCGLLCDVNNIFVSASNHGWNAADYLQGLPAASIEEIHLAGHAMRVLDDGRVLRIDNHGSRVAPEVWDLYRVALRLYGPKPTLIEWDTDIPALEVLLDEAAHAQRLIEEAADAERLVDEAAHAPRSLIESPAARLRAHAAPALLAVQHAIRPRLLEPQRAAAAGTAPSCALAEVPGLSAEMASRLSIYRNTCRSVLVHALQLSFPAVQRLVGNDFFEATAEHFIDGAPRGIPRSAWLNEYGAAFPQFLESFAPAAKVPYLADVARLEWAVNGALHAPDAKRLDPARLADLIGIRAGRRLERRDVRLVPHPTLTLLALGFPADTIWQAVLEGDDEALARLDLAEGPVWLLIERDATGARVRRLSQTAWRFTARVCAGNPLHATLAREAGDAELAERAAMLLAEHLAAGRFTDAVLIESEALRTSPSTCGSESP